MQAQDMNEQMPRELVSAPVERTIEVVKGGKILIFGDLHLSSSYEGSHKNYALECFENMFRILDIVKKEKPSCVIFLGDIAGVKERNVRDRRFLREVIVFFQTLNEITNHHVYTVKGNHDVGDYTDFDLLLGLGVLKNPKYVDYYGDKDLEVRFHFVNYGEENKSIQLPEGDASNVILCHADIQIQGVTTWFYTNNGYQLSSMVNWTGVDLVLPGHIHTPSTEISYTNIGNATVALFYIGSPSRVEERYDDCWFMEFQYTPENASTDYKARLFGLKKADEVFYPKEELVGEEEFDANKVHSDTLKEIIGEVLGSKLNKGSLFEQIDIYPASEGAKSLAKDYLQRAIDGKL